MSPDNHDDYITRDEFTSFRQYLKDLADQQTATIDERIKALTWRMLLALGVAVGLLRFDVPTPVTAGAVAAAVAAALFKAATVFFGGRSL